MRLYAMLDGPRARPDEDWSVTLPKRGTRRIEVDGTPYRWTISVDADWERPESRGCDNHWLVVEQPEFPGRTLTVGFPYWNYHDGFSRPITPGTVAEIIKVATGHGWPPGIQVSWRRYWRDNVLMTKDDWLQKRESDK